MTTRGEAIAQGRSIVRPPLVRRRPVVLATIGLIALAISLVAGVAFGAVSVAPGDTIAILLHRLLGFDLARTWSPAAETIVFDLRLPRVLSAMLVGLGLAVAGATFQGLLRNPLADPYVLGTASGAALGAAVAVLIPVRVLVLEFGLLHGLAFVGALVAVFTVYRLSRIGGMSPLTGLLLTGYAVGSLLAAGLAMAMYLSGAGLRQIFAYLLGGFDSASWLRLAAAAPLVLLPAIAIAARARVLNGLLLGEEAAVHLGVDVRRERAILLALGSLITAAAVAISGLIGFVGLVVPHVVRLLVGPNARLVIPLSALFGASLLTAADLAARLLGEIPVGVVTAVIGAPFFLVLLRRTRTGYEL
ncbi:MAG TPA: iron chelate uptake ABC transporter family permease subunit [Candidatus Limnocylindrales bacterium]|nr:iron chelate uptake ABC transporter family permease subunit [Candidatus Limnocylindrales bacterium]